MQTRARLSQNFLINLPKNFVTTTEIYLTQKIVIKSINIKNENSYVLVFRHLKFLERRKKLSTRVESITI